MATYPINVTYTPQVTGSHIVCYQQNSPIDDGATFCCMLDNTPSIIGTPKVFQIPDVAFPSCDYSGSATALTPGIGTTFNGYVAPLCNPALKTPWTDPVIFAGA